MKNRTMGLLNTDKYKTPIIDVDESQEVRCPNPRCNHLMLKGEVKKIRTKCPKCKQFFSYEKVN